MILFAFGRKISMSISILLAVQRIFGLRKYNGSVIFVPAPGYETYGEPLDLENQIIVDGEADMKSDEQYSYHGPEVDVKSLNWRKVDGSFVSIWLHNVPWGGEDAMVAPNAEDIPKFALLKSMTKLNSGGHVKSPFVSYLKVQRFQTRAYLLNNLKAGITYVDGEVVARGKGAYKCNEETLMSFDKIIIKVDQGLATLFSPNN